MVKPPLILVTPSTQRSGVEFGDVSLSLSECYEQAVMVAGGLPLIMPSAVDRDLIAECVRHCDGVMLTGGDDVNPDLYSRHLPPRLARTVGHTDKPRDLRELTLIEETFRQRKPLLAICRGHQLLNVALGGTLMVDIAAQLPAAINHVRLDKKSAVVHEVQLTGASLLAKISGKQRVGVNSSHHQAVARVARPLRVTAQSDDGIVEGLELRPEAMEWLPYLVSVQYHPERLVVRHPEHRELFCSFTHACVRNRQKTS
jgi:putative glutamine amidotransferase